MFDELVFISEMQDGVRSAMEKMATEYPRVVVYTISIWTDVGTARSAISFDTFENSMAQCEAANASESNCVTDSFLKGIVGERP